jgi:hypothetical protein
LCVARGYCAFVGLMSFKIDPVSNKKSTIYEYGVINSWWSVKCFPGCDVLRVRDQHFSVKETLHANMSRTACRPPRDSACVDTCRTRRPAKSRSLHIRFYVTLLGSPADLLV